MTQNKNSTRRKRGLLTKEEYRAKIAEDQSCRDEEIIRAVIKLEIENSDCTTLYEKQLVSVNAIYNETLIHPATLRRDLFRLAKDKQLKHVRMFTGKKVIGDFYSLTTSAKETGTAKLDKSIRETLIFESLERGDAVFTDLLNETGIEYSMLYRDLLRLVKFRRVIKDRRKNSNSRYCDFYSLPDEPKFNRPK